jgi:NAD(P)H-nitrite reductase large subunit
MQHEEAREAVLRVLRDAGHYSTASMPETMNLKKQVRRASEAEIGVHLATFRIMRNKRARQEWLDGCAPAHTKLLVMARYEERASKPQERLTVTWHGMTIMRKEDGSIEPRSPHEPDTADLTTAIATATGTRRRNVRR